MPAKIGFLFAILGACLSPTTVRAEDPLDHFESRVRPLLADKCYSCHSEQSGKRKGGLLLDRREGWQVGGDSGPAVVRGAPDASLLIQAVRREHEELAMPPDETLGVAEIAILERWILEGAPDPRDGIAETSTVDLIAGREHWAFRPMADPTPPEVGGESETTIDRFILRSLTDAGLRLSSQSDRQALIRRASFVLTGLPPTRAELDAFLDDPSDEAFEHVVDRLLASPHFGERWGRMWLDLARYADSNGLDENLAHGYAWRYRDYVVGSWNDDKPYDQFLREQLAGDLLPPTGDENADLDRLVATGFLSLGPKMLAEQDKDKLAIDIVDEQLDVAMQAFQGMTVGCARCHDHKFDPIPTADYYAIAGIFRSTKTMEHFNHVSAWHEVEIATAAEREARRGWEEEKKGFDSAHAALESEITRALEGRWRRAIDGALLAARANRAAIVHLEAEAAVETNLHADDKQWGGPGVTVLHTHQGGKQFAAWEIAVPRGGAYRLSMRYAAQEARPMVVSLDGELLLERAFAATTGGWLPAHQRWDDFATVELSAGTHRLRIEREGAVPHFDRLRLVPLDAAGNPDLIEVAGVALPPEVIIGWADFLARPERIDDPFFGPWVEFAALDDTSFVAEFPTRAAALRARIGAKERPLSPLVGALLDGLPPVSLREFAGRVQALLSTVDPVDGTPKEIDGDAKKKKIDRLGADALRAVVRGTDGPFSVAMQRRLELCPPDLAARLEVSRARGKTIAVAEPPKLPRAMAVADGAPKDLPIHVRGSHLSLAANPTPRGALSINDHLVPRLSIPEGTSGRRELADWMLHPEHPLTARVIVNRVWQGLFGEGLMRTPSNLGRRGDPPSHPELLDRLARDFIDDDWSLKRLIRRIVLTRVWQQRSDHELRGAEIDPENRLLWRQNRRRLEAEWVRDALLSVSGQLDRAVGGTLLATRDRGYVTNDQSRNQARYDAPRRSIYLPVIRNAMYELFSAFDFNDPSVPVDRRPTTVVAHQALFFLNSPLAIEAASGLAAQTAEAASDDERLEQLLWHAWGRAPTEAERDRMLNFLARAIPILAASPPPAPPLEKEEGMEDAMSKEPAAVASESPVLPTTPRERAWQALAQAILAASEFTYFD